MHIRHKQLLLAIDQDTVQGPKVFDLSDTASSIENMNTVEEKEMKMKEVYGEVHEYLKQSK